MSVTRLLILSDLHVGSIFGMLPPAFVTSDDKEVMQNAGQRYLWDCWSDMLAHVKKLKLGAVIVNGDVIDGTQRAQRGTELSLPMLFDQQEATVDLLRPLKRMAPLYFVQGTEYHDCKAGASVDRVAESLDAVRYRGLGTGKYSREVLDLAIGDSIVNFAHGISVASGFYRATPVDREGVWSALAGKAGQMPKADCVIRSHAHYFVHLEHASKHIIITPCWQLQTRFMRKNSVYRMVPDIGYIIVEVNTDAKGKGEDPISITKRLYPLPELKPTALVVG